MFNTPDSPAKTPGGYTTQGGNFWTLITPEIWKVLHAVLQREHITELLFEGDFQLADQIYARDCASWWRSEDYGVARDRAFQAKAKRRAAEDEKRQEQERIQLRSQVLNLIVQGRNVEAESLYRQSCSAWWDEQSYALSKQKQNCTREFLDRYRDGTLGQLDEFFLASRDLDLGLDDYIELKKHRLTRLLAQVGQSLDDEQLSACARPERRLLIRARAGSGKTRTLCARASVAIRDERLDPDQVLIVAFNKSAALEVTKRMQKDFGCTSFQNARTFHSLAYQLAKPKKQLLFDEGRHPSKRAQTVFVQRLLERVLKAKPAVKQMLYEFFRKEIEEIERIGRNLLPTDYRLFRRSLEQVSLAGERVRSTGEKYIADFLFEHGVTYRYEPIVDWWKTAPGQQSQPYRPDFSIIANGRQYILEHWAIDPDNPNATLPDDWDTTAAEYREQIYRKRDYWEGKDTPLLETNSQQIQGSREGFEAHLKFLMGSAGIPCQRLPDEEIIRRVFEKDFHISRMAEQFLQFIQRAKKRCLSVDDVSKLVSYQTKTDGRRALFHQLALLMYREYQSELDAQNAIDFDDLLRMATDEVCRQGASTAIYLGNSSSIRIGDLRWLMVDEYQDFSELYYRMLQAILEANSSLRLMAVGDDWQAINGFAGAELRFFEDFEEYFPGAGETTIATNYRSARAVVEWGNRLMSGRGVQARPKKNALSGETRVIDTSQIWIEFRDDPQFAAEREKDRIFLPTSDNGKPPTMGEKRLARVLKSAAALHHQTGSKRLLLVSRTKLAYGVELGYLQRRLVDVIVALTGEDPDTVKPRIRVMTAHTSKGQEEDAVIVLDTSENNFPKVHPDNLLYEIFGVTATEVLAEERRLFYVAITRPAEKLWILTDAGSTSSYVTQLKSDVDAGGHDQSAPAARIKKRGDPAIYERLRGLIEALPDTHQSGMEKLSEPTTNPWQEVIADVVASLQPTMLEISRISGLAVPVVAFELEGSDDLVAELAWPKHSPPVAILSGNQVDFSNDWISAGWTMIDAKTVIQSGSKLLLDVLECPSEKSENSFSAQDKGISNEHSIALKSSIAGLRHAIGKILPSTVFCHGDSLEFQRESKNVNDTFAVRVMHKEKKVGYLPKPCSAVIAKHLDEGKMVTGLVDGIDDATVDVQLAIVA
jgi:DNA helicase-4